MSAPKKTMPSPGFATRVPPYFCTDCARGMHGMDDGGGFCKCCRFPLDDPGNLSADAPLTDKEKEGTR